MGKKLKYYDNLPKKRMASGFLFFNEDKEILIVKPNYRKDWSVPGGVIEKNESPRQAGIRETKEEIGIIPKTIKLLCIDYMSPEVSGYPTKDENIQFIFYGGILNKKQILKIKININELEEYKFVSAREALRLVSDRLAKRLPNCLKAIKENRTFYLEGGKIF